MYSSFSWSLSHSFLWRKHSSKMHIAIGFACRFLSLNISVKINFEILSWFFFINGLIGYMIKTIILILIIIVISVNSWKTHRSKEDKNTDHPWVHNSEILTPQIWVNFFQDFKKTFPILLLFCSIMTIRYM